MNCIKTASWRIAAGALSAVLRKRLKGIEEYLPDECSGMTGELAERDSPRSMLKMFLDHARVQVSTGGSRDFEKASRQQTLQTEAR